MIFVGEKKTTALRGCSQKTTVNMFFGGRFQPLKEGM